jgi:hypothetical protein
MSSARSTGRLRLVGLLVPVLMLWLVVGCAGSQQQSVPPVAGSFVGEAPDANAFVALVADLPEGDGNERQVRAYLCDGQSISDWFAGSVAGNDLNLSSDSGAQLKGQLTSDAATGTITDPNGNPISFEAPLATGIAGLYDVNLLSAGALSGTSQTGGQLEGQLGNILEEYGTYPVSGTITPPDGQPQDFKALTSPNSSDHHRWIVLADGRIKGGNVGGGFEFDRRFSCDFNDFDDFDFNHCSNFNFNRFVFVDNFDRFDFDQHNFDRNNFDRNNLNFNDGGVGGTFGQVGGGGSQGSGGGKGGGQGGKGGGQGGGGGKGK